VRPELKKNLVFGIRTHAQPRQRIYFRAHECVTKTKTTKVSFVVRNSSKRLSLINKLKIIIIRLGIINNFLSAVTEKNLNSSSY